MTVPLERPLLLQRNEVTVRVRRYLVLWELRCVSPSLSSTIQQGRYGRSTQRCSRRSALAQEPAHLPFLLPSRFSSRIGDNDGLLLDSPGFLDASLEAGRACCSLCSASPPDSRSSCASPSSRAPIDHLLPLLHFVALLASVSITSTLTRRLAVRAGSKFLFVEGVMCCS